MNCPYIFVPCQHEGDAGDAHLQSRTTDTHLERLTEVYYPAPTRKAMVYRDLKQMWNNGKPYDITLRYLTVYYRIYLQPVNTRC